MYSMKSKILFWSLVACMVLVWFLSSDASRARKVQREILAQADAAGITLNVANTTTAPRPYPENTNGIISTTEAIATTEAVATTEAIATTEAPEPSVTPSGDIVLLFGGDVNLDADYNNFRGVGTAKDFIDKTLLNEMNSADVFMHGNLSALTDSENGMKKTYLFKADPEEAGLLVELGTDIVSLANNHSLDFGAEGLADTMAALDSNGIAYVGAGANEESAKEPYYLEIGGKRIAFTAAMRSERYPKAPEAIGEKSGVVKMYDLENYLDIVREAAKNSDFVVAYAHWGVENTIWLEQEQLDGARALINAGADIVVGAHSYTLQTVEYYKGRPIFYGLGSLSGEGGLAKITISEDGDISAKIIPFNVTDGITTPLSGKALDEKIAELDYISSSTVTADGDIVE